VRKLTDSLPEATIIIDRRSLVVHRNPEAVRQFPQAIEGQPIAFSLRHPPVIDAVERARRAGVQTVEMHRTIPNETWHRVTIAPLAAGDPVNEGVLVLTLLSLTEAKRLEALRSDFIANASHELRTPLAALIGFIDTLLGPAANDAPARERFLGLMRAQAARMSKLIDDLLSLSRIEMRQHMRPMAPVDLALVLGEVTAGLEPLARETGTTIRLAIAEGTFTIPGDRDELYEVFENLMENGIKYGADSGPVEVSLRPSDRPGFVAEVTVIDHGPGVAPEHVPRLTERFYRVDAESSRRKKGTGLGLAIVKHIMGRHHGDLNIRSAEGEGLRVTAAFRA
jgi:two-component system phosphate regulon sensor histidine kinase PhoR